MERARPPAPGDGATARAAHRVAARTGAAARRYSPVVQRIAAEHGIDLATVTGTGRGGRVRKQDVLALVNGADGGAHGGGRRCTSRVPTGPSPAAPAAAAAAGPPAPAAPAAGRASCRACAARSAST